MTVPRGAAVPAPSESSNAALSWPGGACAGSQYAAHWHEGKPTWVQPSAQLSGGSGAAAAARGGGGGGGVGPGTPQHQQHQAAEDLEPGEQLRLSQAARSAALQAAALAEQQALGHWDAQGATQRSLRAALEGAQQAAESAQAARARALELAQRLDVAIALATQQQQHRQAGS